ncbi:MAG: class I SAM-dependent methyltransferase [Tannerellaceae bacterium]
MENKIYSDSYDQGITPNILQWVTPNTKVLEFGAATGYMTQYMQEKLNCDVTIVELSEEMARKASKFASKAIVANLETDDWYSQIDSKYDYILFADVLEHLRCPSNVLVKAITLLKPNGYILTSIPNIGHNSVVMELWKGEFNYRPYGLLDNTHVSFFTRKTLIETFSKLGLKSIAELDQNVHPSITEMKNSYFSFPILSLFLLRRKDAHVYQFINKWSLADTPETACQLKPYRLSMSKMLLALLDDMNEWLHNKYNFKIQLPKQIKKIVRT